MIALQGAAKFVCYNVGKYIAKAKMSKSVGKGKCWQYPLFELKD